MQADENPFFRVEPLADGVFAALAKPGEGAWANAGIIALGRSALVVDAMFTPAAGAALRATAERLTQSPVRWLVLTHRDHDHVLGSQAFRGATIISARRTAERMRDRAPAFLAAARREGGRWLLDLDAAEQAQVDAHDRTRQAAMRADYRTLFSQIEDVAPLFPALLLEEDFTIHGQRRTVQILSFGGVHTESDTVVYLPGERILFSGDLVQVGLHPAVRHGRPRDWLHVFGRVADLEADLVLGGHGPVGTREDILLAERYYYELAEWAGGAPVPEPFASWDAPQTLLENLRYAQTAAAR